MKIIFDREVACSVSGAPASIVATDIDETVLARSLLCRAAIGDLQDIVRAIKARGASLKAETNLHREHQLEGIAKAKAAGVYKGRPSAFFFLPSCALTEWPSVRVASLRRFRPTSAGGGNAESPSRRERRAVARRASSQ